MRDAVSDETVSYSYFGEKCLFDVVLKIDV